MQSAQPASKSSLSYRVAILAMLAAGIALAFFIAVRQAAEDRLHIHPVQWIIPLVITGLAFIPAVNRRLVRFMQRQRGLSPRQQRLTAVALAVAAILWFIVASVVQGQVLIPKIHDEFCYLIQAHIFARGCLWMPAHPLGTVLESFYLITQPVYTAMYFPGTAMMQVPGVWLGLPSYIMPLLISGACVGLLYLVVARLSDPALALVAAIMLMCGPTMVRFAPQILSFNPILLLTLAMIWAWINWRDKPNVLRAAMFGAIAGWAAITRPSDAAAFALPLAVAVLPTLLKIGGKKTCIQMAVVLLCAAPFLSIQLALDKKITGHALVTVHEYTMARQIGVKFGWQRTGPQQPLPSPLPQRRTMYERFYAPILRESLRYNRLEEIAKIRLPRAVEAGLPVVFLVALLPLGLLQIHRRSRWILPAAMILFFAVYMFYPAFQIRYALVVSPALILLAVLAAPALGRAFASFEANAAAVLIAFMVGCCVGTAVVTLGQSESAWDAWVRKNSERLAAVRPPAIVLCTYDNRADPNYEPVYNADVSWPDDAPVIRLHDLGPQSNQTIYNYYAHLKNAPDRAVWQMNPAAATMKYVGTVRELAGQTPTTRQ